MLEFHLHVVFKHSIGMIQRIIMTTNVAKRIIPHYKMMATIEIDHQSQN